MSNRPRPLVLIVDDCECVRDIIKYVLRELAGIHAVGASTSEEALKLAQRRKFDVVISDINRWPGMNGLEFLKVFKQSHAPVLVIIASGVLDEVPARQAKWLRAFDCLPKPFGCNEILTQASHRSVKRALAPA
jgi:DNA-binding NtrC family response regulator